MSSGAARLRRSVLRAVSIAGSLLVVSPHFVRQELHAHALHTSYSDVTFNPATGALTASVRVFADDFTRHVMGAAGGPAIPSQSADARAYAYLRSTLVLTGRNGAIPLAWCGWQRKADMLIICLKGTSRDGLAGVKVDNAILMDLFSDQLNILQVTLRATRQSLLFTRTAHLKTLS